MNFYRPVWADNSIDRLFDQLCKDLLTAPSVDTGHWQAKKDVPQVQSRELRNVIMELPISGSPGGWSSWMKPNLPWAEDHFQERVGGEPLNPPPSHVNWPFNQRGNEDHMDGVVFSHSYPERLWPCRAGDIAEKQRADGFEPSPVDVNMGIRYRYGDLDDLVTLLTSEPHTRQAYVPLWFPEDLAAAVEGQRVPCTLGYHFILRSNQLHCFYPMRSLDVLRYFRDDAYMAGRLCQWLIGRCHKTHEYNENSVWHHVTPGTLTLHAVSCHVFENDIPIINHLLGKKPVAA